MSLHMVIWGVNHGKFTKLIISRYKNQLKQCFFYSYDAKGPEWQVSKSGAEVSFARGRSVFCKGPKCLFTTDRSVLTRGRSVFSKKGRSVQSGPKWQGPKWQGPMCPKFLPFPLYQYDKISYLTENHYLGRIFTYQYEILK